jgi:WD40 repeat protein
MLFLRGHTDRVRCLAYAPDGRTLITGGIDGTVRLWDLDSGVEVETLDCRQLAVNALALAPDGRLLATAGQERTVKLWYVPALRPRVVLYGHEEAVRALAFAPDGAMLVSASGFESRKRVGRPQALAWDAETGRMRASLREIGGQFRAVAFAPGGSEVAVGSGDAAVIFWDPASAPAEASYRAFGRRAWPGPFVCDAAGRPLRVRTPLHTRAPVDAVAYAPDGRVLAVANGRAVRLWDLVASAALGDLKGHRDRVTSLAFAPGGRALATASRDGTVRFWGVAGRGERACLDPGLGRLNALAFSPDGNTAAAAGEADVAVWDLDGDLLS